MGWIHVPGATVIGNVSGAGGGANLSDIDMTADRADPRLIFECLSPRAFIAKDGTIQFAAPNDWPLEYKDGVAVGRHEPEPQRTNYRLNSIAPPGNFYLMAKTGSLVPTPTGETGYIEYLTQSGISATAAMFYDLTFDSDRKITFSVIGKNGTATLTMGREGNTERPVLGSEFGLTVLHTQYVSTDARNRYSIFFGNQPQRTGYVWSAQLEEGEFATSPIITSSAAATRAAAFGAVLNPGMLATAARIYYTDGTTYDIDLAGTPRGAIPQSSKDWGARYIEGISYAKGFSR